MKYTTQLKLHSQATRLDEGASPEKGYQDYTRDFHPLWCFVPGDLNLSAFAESMFRLKERGLTSKVGVSLDTPHHGDLTWCDTIEVPLRGLNWHRLKSSQEIVVNSIIKEGGLVAGNDLLNQLHDFKDLTALLGTGSLNHWKDFVKKLNGDVT